MDSPDILVSSWRVTDSSITFVRIETGLLLLTASRSMEGFFRRGLMTDNPDEDIPPGVTSGLGLGHMLFCEDAEKSV